MEGETDARPTIVISSGPARRTAKAKLRLPSLKRRSLDLEKNDQDGEPISPDSLADWYVQAMHRQ